MTKTQRRKKLAWAGVLLVSCLLNAAFFFTVLPTASRGLSDFACFYAAGHLIATGRANQLYDYTLQAATQRALLRSVRDPPLIFNHLPYEAVAFVPFARFPFPTAYLLWCIANLLLLLICCAHLLQTLEGLRARWEWFALGVLAFPAVVDLAIGQDSIPLLLVYVLVFDSFRRGKMFWAGAFLALGLFKFQFVLPLVIAFLRNGRRKGITGFLLVAVLIGGVSVAVVGTAGAQAYLRTLNTQMWHTPEDAAASSPVMMPNIRGLLFTTFRRYTSRTNLDLATAIVSLLAMLALLAAEPPLDQPKKEELQLLFSVYLVGTVLVSYHAHIYDLVVLLLPIFLLANRDLLRFEDVRTRFLLIAWVVLGAPLYCLLLACRSANLFCFVLLALAWQLAAATQAHRQNV